MTLREYCKTVTGEVEVWDKEIDISYPYYNYDGENTFDDDKTLVAMENWFLSLPVADRNGNHCSVDVFSAIKDCWKNIVEKMNDDGGYEFFLSNWGEDINDDEAIADYVEDIFTCLSQGLYGFAKDFCKFMDLTKESNRDIIDKVMKRYMNGSIKVIALDTHPNWDTLGDYIDLDDISVDLSHGMGNVIRRYFYIPALDLIFSYTDY